MSEPDTKAPGVLTLNSVLDGLRPSKLLPVTDYNVSDTCWIVLARDEATGKLTQGRIIAKVSVPWHAFDFYLIETADAGALHVETRQWIYMAPDYEQGQWLARTVKSLHDQRLAALSSDRRN